MLVSGDINDRKDTKILGELLFVPGDSTNSDSIDNYLDTIYIELVGYADDTDVNLLT
jgi:hypothetical protein